MEKALQTVGLLLLLGVLMLGVLTYSNVAGVGDSLKLIKEGVDRLVNWFIPTKSNITIVVGNYSGVKATVSGNKVIINGTFSSSAIYTDIVKITAMTDKEATLVINVDNGLPDSLTFTVVASNAIVDKQTVTASAQSVTTEKITIYPTGTGTVTVSLTIVPGTNYSGAVTIEVLLSYLK
jgi:hypothetical protein